MISQSSVKLAPIAFFVYKRLEHAKQTLQALAANTLASESDLFIFSDGSKNKEDAKAVQSVRDYIRTVEGFKSVTIREHETNLGCAKAPIFGITELCERFGRVIVVEDDILTSPQFLSFMNEGLEKYKDNEDVFAISGLWPLKPRRGSDRAFFMRTFNGWGWATWKRAWDFYDYNAAGWEKLLKNKRLAWHFNLQGRYNFTEMLLDQMRFDIQAWDIQWQWVIFSRKGKILFPPYSLSTNIGFGNLSTHTSERDGWFIKNIDLRFDTPIVMPDRCDVDEKKHEEYAEFNYMGARDSWHRYAKMYIIRFVARLAVFLLHDTNNNENNP